MCTVRCTCAQDLGVQNGIVEKASDFFREFQNVRSRSDVKKVRARIWRRRRRRILYIRNSMEEEDEEEEEGEEEDKSNLEKEKSDEDNTHPLPPIHRTILQAIQSNPKVKWST